MVSYYPTLLSHKVHSLKRLLPWDPPLISQEWACEILKSSDLPTPHEQGKNLILWLGERSKIFPHNYVSIEEPELPAVIGTEDEEGIAYIVSNLLREDLLDVIDGYNYPHNFRLTIKGWTYYDELLKASRDSKTAFMAMPFRYDDINENFKNHYIAAVEQTGFKLERVNDNPEAGNITNKILVDIRRSKFVLVELTYGNQGAYWEAGYAEGLGKPVIYLCSEPWSKDNGGTHFDIRNHQTVFWHPDNMPEAMERLKAAIRATLPDEALMEDPEVEVTNYHSY
jgi:hypothetical protein